VHFAAPDIPAMRAWYASTFGAVPGMRGAFQAADLPGVNLTFSGAPAPVVGTKGRALDHIGFEVKGLENFVRQLEARGIKVDRAYTYSAQLGVGLAFLTDPWGTNIELNGLSSIRCQVSDGCLHPSTQICAVRWCSVKFASDLRDPRCQMGV
jgi:catechol 2,3-dioxygenase-like lactoylglutathione lyase family enzyme